MAKIDRVNGNVKAFASQAVGTERTLFGTMTQANDLTSQFTSAFLRGWGTVGPSDEPSMEDFNAAMYTHGQLIAYLHQAGIAEYNSQQEYFSGSVVQFGGLVYTSLQGPNTGNSPDVNATFWRPITRGVLLATRSFTGNGTYVPTPGTKTAIARLVGGGGGGGGSAATNATQISVGGGAGSGSTIDILITDPSSMAYAVGSGGPGVLAGTGMSGGATSLGGLAAAPGGGPGSSVIIANTSSNAGSPGLAGATPAGNVPIILSSKGQPGTPGLALAGFVYSGNGGSGMYGGGAIGVSSGAGLPGGGPGAGGSGAGTGPSGPANAGGSGAAGALIIMEYA